MYGPPQTWVSLKEASERAGVSVSWLRKQYRTGGLATREVLGSRGAQKAVPLEDVLSRAAAFTGAATFTGAAQAAPPPPAAAPASTAFPASTFTAPAAGRAGPPATVPVTFGELLTLVERLTQAGHDHTLLERVVEVERRAAQAEAESAYLRLRLEDAFAEIDALRDQLGAELGAEPVEPGA